MGFEEQIKKWKKYCKAFLLFFVMLNFADCVSTRMIMTGGGRELNAITSFLMGLMGYEATILFKLIFGCAFAWVIWVSLNKYTGTKELKKSFVIIAFLNIIYLAVVLCNIMFGYAWIGVK